MSKSAPEIERGIRAALGTCTCEAAGLWAHMRYVIEQDSDRPGHLRQNGRPMSASQLAREAGCDASTVPRLQQELSDSGLIVMTGECPHSPQLARLAQVRAGGADRVRRHRQNKAGGHVEQSANRVLRNTPSNAGVTPAVTPGTPSPGFPPRTPLPTPTPGKISVAAQPTAAAGGAGDAAGRSAKPRTARQRALTDEQLATRNAFTTWYSEQAWPKRHEGLAYPFDGSRDAAAVIKLLKFVKWELVNAQAFAITYLDFPDVYTSSAENGKPIWAMVQKLARWAVETQKRLNGKTYGHQPKRTGHHASHIPATGDVPDYGG